MLDAKLRDEIEQMATKGVLLLISHFTDIEFDREYLSMEGTAAELRSRANAMRKVCVVYEKPQHIVHALNYLAAARDMSLSTLYLYELSFRVKVWYARISGTSVEEEV